MSIPFPNPVNRDQARRNAMYYAREMDGTVVSGAARGPGEADLMKANLWARIADTFPEDELVQTVKAPLHRGMFDSAASDRFRVVRRVGPGEPTVMVESALWDAMRVLAVRAARARPDDAVVVGPGSVDEEANLGATVAPNGTVRFVVR